MLIGYARVSTTEQNLDLQIFALSKVGCVKILHDVASGAECDRDSLYNCDQDEAPLFIVLYCIENKSAHYVKHN